MPQDADYWNHNVRYQPVIVAAVPVGLPPYRRSRAICGIYREEKPRSRAHNVKKIFIG
jgi:hypothetical protein